MRAFFLANQAIQALLLFAPSIHPSISISLGLCSVSSSSLLLLLLLFFCVSLRFCRYDRVYKIQQYIYVHRKTENALSTCGNFLFFTSIFVAVIAFGDVVVIIARCSAYFIDPFLIAMNICTSGSKKRPHMANCNATKNK